MDCFEPGGCAVVVGASGGIGSALTTALLAEPRFARVVALARSFEVAGGAADRLHRGPIDLDHEASIVDAAARLTEPVRLVIVATGALHGPGLQPEKSFRALDASALLESYRINAVGPALVAKHMLPRLAPTGRTVFAALSARVGSIGDNRLGGWHGYRAAKAALNMILRNLAIETARRNPECLCIGLHPGTVDTGLSRPFQRGVVPDRLFTPAQSAAHLLAVIDGLTATHSGSVMAWDGSIVAA